MRPFWNAARLGVTLAMGLAMLRLASELGASGLALFIWILGLRWLLQPILDAAECACGAGHRPNRTELALMSATGVLFLLLLCPLGAMRFGFPVGPEIVLLSFGHSVWFTLLVRQTPRLGHLSAGGRFAALNLILTLRRAAELIGLALGMMIYAAAEKALLFQVSVVVLLQSAQWCLLIHAEGAVPDTAQASCRTGTPGSFRRAFRASLVNGLSGVVSLRGPVVVFGALASPELSAAAGVLFQLLGQLRQLGSVLLAGLEGQVRRAFQAGPGAAMQMLNITTRSASLALVVAIGAAYLLSPNLLSYLIKDDALPPVLIQVLSPCITIGVSAVGLRVLSEIWTRGALAMGEIRPSALPAGIVAAQLALAGLAAILMPAGGSLWAAVITFWIAQAAHCLVVKRVFRFRAAPSRLLPRLEVGIVGLAGPCLALVSVG